jgi:hypothetical protein
LRKRVETCARLAAPRRAGHGEGPLMERLGRRRAAGSTAGMQPLRKRGGVGMQLVKGGGRHGGHAHAALAHSGARGVTWRAAWA